MQALVTRLYLKLSRTGGNNHEQTMVAVGRSGTMSKPNALRGRGSMIHYALYEGRCLDPKKLSYFSPERTIEEGNLTLEEVRKILAT